MKTIETTRGSVAIKPGPLGPLILTGKRKRWDSLSWSRYDKDTLEIHGLWRGRYAEALCTPAALIHALESIGADAEAARVKAAFS